MHKAQTRIKVRSNILSYGHLKKYFDTHDLFLDHCNETVEKENERKIAGFSKGRGKHPVDARQPPARNFEYRRESLFL